MFEGMWILELEYVGGLTGVESWGENKERKYDKGRDKKAQKDKQNKLKEGLKLRRR